MAAAVRLRVSPLLLLGLAAWLAVLSPSSVVEAAGGTPTSPSSSEANSTSNDDAVARSWSHACLCPISEFKEGCLADANKLCRNLATAAIQLSEASCQEAVAGEVGYFLVHELDVKCQHPYTYGFYETYNLIKALGFTGVDYVKLNDSGIDGKVLFGLTIEQAEHMGLSVGAARHVSLSPTHCHMPHSSFIFPSSFSHSIPPRLNCSSSRTWTSSFARTFPSAT
jgi:hypothetical protein